MDAQAPEGLRAHIGMRQVKVAALEYGEALKDFNDTTFDLAQLEADMKRVMPDFGDRIVKTSKQVQIAFATKTMFEIIPDMRRNKNNNVVSRILFDVTIDGAVVERCVYIATFRNNAAIPKVDGDDVIILTTKQASLLATMVLTKVMAVGLKEAPPVYLVTPLMGGCFSRRDYPTIADKLGISQTELMARMAASSVTGGHLLPKGNGSLAVVFAINAVKNVKDRNIADTIIGKITRQYIMAGKDPESRIISILAPYSQGGVPAEFSVDNLRNIYDSAKANARMMAQARLQAVFDGEAGVATGAGAERMDTA